MIYIDATWRTLHIINRVHCNQNINKNAYSLIFNNKNAYSLIFNKKIHIAMFKII